MANPLSWIDEELNNLDALGLRRRLRVREGPQTGSEIMLDGQRFVNFSSNDYLGLAARCLVPAVADVLDQVGWGSGSSPLITGRGHLHAQLEQQIAEFEGTEAALLFPSGFAANVGTISSLAGRGDVIFSDAKNHASIIDGCRLSGARIQVYPHGDVRFLNKMIRQASDFRRRLIVTDTVFSMDGDLAPLVELADLAEKYEAALMVDEAHATGVFGQSGRGVCEHLGVEDRVHARVGTLSKALGSIGGFVVGSRSLIDWLTNRARSYFFSTAPPEAVAAAGIRALELVRTEPQRRTSLLGRAERLRDRLRQQGFNIGNSQSQIVPVILGDADKTMLTASVLQDRGFFVPGIRPPSVPEGESLLRISLTYDHTDEMIDSLVEALTSI